MGPTATIIENKKIKNPQIEEWTVFRGFIYYRCWPWNTPESKDICSYASLVIAKFWGCYMDGFLHCLCLTIPKNCRHRSYCPSAPPLSKIHKNWKENSIQTILDRKMLLPLSRKIQARTHPLSCFFAAEVPWFNLGAFWVVKPLKSVFCYLEDRGPVKNSKKNCGNVEEYMAHWLIPLTPQ
jgi:hypothetical protein